MAVNEDLSQVGAIESLPGLVLALPCCQETKGCFLKYAY